MHPTHLRHSRSCDTPVSLLHPSELPPLHSRCHSLPIRFIDEDEVASLPPHVNHPAVIEEKQHHPRFSPNSAPPSLRSTAAASQVDAAEVEATHQRDSSTSVSSSHALDASTPSNIFAAALLSSPITMQSVSLGEQPPQLQLPPQLLQRLHQSPHSSSPQSESTKSPMISPVAALCIFDENCNAPVLAMLEFELDSAEEEQSQMEQHRGRAHSVGRTGPSMSIINLPQMLRGATHSELKDEKEEEDSGESQEGTSEWEGDDICVQTPPPRPRPPLRVALSGGSFSNEQVIAAVHSSNHRITPPSRHTKRRRQQHAHVTSTLAHEMHLQRKDLQHQRSHGMIEDQSNESESTLTEMMDQETERSPLAASFRINLSPKTPLADHTNGDSSSEPPLAPPLSSRYSVSSSSSLPPLPKRWYMKKRLMIPLLCILAFLLSAVIALIVLYPQSPNISTTSVRLSDVQWRVDEPSGALYANLTLSVSVLIRNGNAFGSSFEATPVSVMLEIPSGPQQGQKQLVTILDLPAGHIGPKSELSLTISTLITETKLMRASDLALLAQRMRVYSESRTKGNVKFIGLNIPYTVHTQCSATCSIDILTLAVTVLEQECNSSSS